MPYREKVITRKMNTTKKVKKTSNNSPQMETTVLYKKNAVLFNKVILKTTTQRTIAKIIVKMRDKSKMATVLRYLLITMRTHLMRQSSKCINLQKDTYLLVRNVWSQKL